MTTGVSVRALASPGFALALVVLVLNDHVLKTAYPGWITGKLSDVAGLVLAPLLLGVLLTVWRVPRPMLVAIVVVGLGFTLTKSTVAGAAVEHVARAMDEAANGALFDPLTNYGRTLAALRGTRLTIPSLDSPLQLLAASGPATSPR